MMNHFRCRLFLVWVVPLTLCVVGSLHAQTLPDPSVHLPQQGLFDANILPEFTAESAEQVVQKPEGPPPTPRHTGIKAMVKDLGQDVLHIPSKENLFWVGVGGGLALAVHPADDNVNEALVDSDFAHDFFAPGKYIGSLPVLLGTATAIYVTGRAKDQPRVSHVGMDLIQALAISEFMTQSLKHITNRERPDQSDNTSFPSGHAADTFAFATALERHLGWKYAVPAYMFSSYVAISRLPADRHWLSDAVFGSAVGIIAGRTVTRHGRDFPVTVAMVPGGAAVMYVRRPRLSTPPAVASASIPAAASDTPHTEVLQIADW